MRANLSYPARAGFHLEEHWPIKIEGIVFTLRVDDGLVTGVTCEWPLGTDDRPPELAPLAEGQMGMGQVSFHLASRERVDHLLRTIQGLLSLHGAIDIDFERPTLRWIADTPDEVLAIDLVLTANPRKPDLYKPERLEFGVVARSVAAAPAAADREVALSFLRRGQRDLKEGRYIEAFYNNFFFLETLFAGGLSDPKKVKARLKGQPQIAAAFKLVRAHPIDLPRGFVEQEDLQLWEERWAYLDRADDAIIDDLVNLRGQLHHHSMRDRAAWHPDNARLFRAASYALRDIAHGVADALFGSLIFEEDYSNVLGPAAERAGAVTVLRVEAEGIFLVLGRTHLSVDLRMPGTVITRGMIEAADLHFREWLPSQLGERAIVTRYTITNVADGRPYGRYARATPKR